MFSVGLKFYVAVVPPGTLAFPSPGGGCSWPERCTVAPRCRSVCGKVRAVKHIIKCQCMHQASLSDHELSLSWHPEGRNRWASLWQIHGQWFLKNVKVQRKTFSDIMLKRSGNRRSELSRSAKGQCLLMDELAEGLQLPHAFVCMDNRTQCKGSGNKAKLLLHLFLMKTQWHFSNDLS